MAPTVCSRLCRAGLLLLSMLGLAAYLWASWVQLLRVSAVQPATHGLNATLGRAHTVGYDTLKYAVLVTEMLQAAAQNEIVPSLSKPVTVGSTVTSAVVYSPCSLIGYLVEVQRQSRLFGFGVGLEDGSMYWVYWNFTLSEFEVVVVDKQNTLGLGTEPNEYLINRTDCVDNTTLVRQLPPYDVTTYPSYARGKQERFWTPPYESSVIAGLLIIDFISPLTAAPPDSNQSLGIFFADQWLHRLGNDLREITEGEAFIMVKGGTPPDLMIAASSGGIATGSPPRPITPAQSENADIRAAYHWLLDKYADGKTLRSLTDERLLLAGDIFTGEPLIGTEKFSDERLQLEDEDIGWQIVVTYHNAPYYDHAWWLFGLTAGLAGVMVALVLWMAWAAYKRQVPSPGAFIGVACIIVGLYFLWIVTIKFHTDSVIDDALSNQAADIQQYAAVLWNNNIWATYMTSVCYQFGSLDLDVVSYILALPLTGQGQAGSQWTIGILGNTYQAANQQIQTISASAVAVKIGYSNGDVSGFQYECRRTGACTDQEYITFFIRATDPAGITTRRRRRGNSYLYKFNTTLDAAGNLLPDYSKQVSVSEDSYSSFTQVWYSAGTQCGMLTTKNGQRRYNKTCLSNVYLPVELEWTHTASNGSTSSRDQLMISFTQPFIGRKDSSEVAGVIAVDVNFDDSSQYAVNRYAINAIPKLTEYSVVEHEGEVLMASNQMNTQPGSGGHSIRIFVSQTFYFANESGNIPVFGWDLWNTYGPGYTHGQNVSDLVGYVLETSANFAYWNSTWKYGEAYQCLPQKLQNWTQLCAVERQSFFKDYDSEMGTSFAAILFGLTAVVFVNQHVLTCKL